MATASYIRTTGSGNNWYEVNISDLTAELQEYFMMRADRDSRYTIIGEKTIQWSTQFEFADQLLLEGVEMATNGLRLKCSAVLSVADRRALAAEARKSLKKPASVAASASSKISINPEDAEF